MKTTLFVLALTLAPALGLAQELPSERPDTDVAPARAPTAAPPSVADAARVDFEAGITALEDARYADALVAFERSYRTRRVASVALNLGVTLRALGRLIEARQRLRDFLALASPAQHAQRDVEVAGYLAVIERQVARLHLGGFDLASAVLHVDQRRVRPDSAAEVELDPGEHRLSIEEDGYLPEHRTVRVEAGETQDVHVSLSRPGGWLFTRWWFWSGVVAVVGAGVTAGVLYSQTPLDPPATNTGIIVQTGGL